MAHWKCLVLTVTCVYFTCDVCNRSPCSHFQSSNFSNLYYHTNIERISEETMTWQIDILNDIDLIYGVLYTNIIPLMKYQETWTF